MFLSSFTCGEAERAEICVSMFLVFTKICWLLDAILL